MTFTRECEHLGKGIDATMDSSAKTINQYAEFILCERTLNTSTMVRLVLAAYVANHINSFIEKKKMRVNGNAVKTHSTQFKLIISP